MILKLNLKTFLHFRDKNSVGGQKSLAAKDFSSWCDKLLVNPEVEHSKIYIRVEYKAKLVINKDIVIPDLLAVKSWWIAEAKGT